MTRPPLDRPEPTDQRHPAFSNDPSAGPALPTSPSSTRATRAALTVVLVTLLIDVMGIGLILPVLPRLVKDLSGSAALGAQMYGLLVSLYAAMQFLLAPLLGTLSDRYGRRPVLLLSLLGTGLNYLLLSLAPGLAWLVLGRVVAGITGASITVANAYVADISSPDRRTVLFGYVGAATGAGFILGPALGGLLGSVDIRLPFLFAAGLALLNFGFGWWHLPESLPTDQRAGVLRWRAANPLASLGFVLSAPELRGPAVGYLLLSTAGQILASTWVLFTEAVVGWSPVQNGAALALVGVTTVLVQARLISVTVRKVGERGAILLGLTAGTVQFLLLAFARTDLALSVAIVVGSLLGLAGPGLQGWISRQGGRGAQGQVQGAIGSMTSLVGMGAPLLATTLFAAFSRPEAPLHLPGAAFLLAAGLLAISAAVVLNERPADGRQGSDHSAVAGEQA